MPMLHVSVKVRLLYPLVCKYSNIESTEIVTSLQKTMGHKDKGFVYTTTLYCFLNVILDLGKKSIFKT